MTFEFGRRCCTFRRVRSSIASPGFAAEPDGGRVASLAQSDAVKVPMLIGVLRPVIVVPSAALSGLKVDEMEMVLAHELAHLRRGDAWIHLLQRFRRDRVILQSGSLADQPANQSSGANTVATSGRAKRHLASRRLTQVCSSDWPSRLCNVPTPKFVRWRFPASDRPNFGIGSRD